MRKLDFRSRYADHVESLKKSLPLERAMEQAVGGQFEAVGILERELLISQYLSGKYLGIDIVPDLCEYARQLVGRADWRFEVAEGLSIPEADATADIVCFFSVFTHLLHEQSYRYLQEAKRVLKSGGKIIFSFLEFAIPSHWAVFEAMIPNRDESSPLNMFISRDGITAWALHLGLRIEALHDGDTPHIPLPHPLVLEDGSLMKEKGNLGQSVCVLVK